MKKILLVFFIYLIMPFGALAETLKGSAILDEIPKGFFGTWHVTSKMVESTNDSMFNPISVDIWNLSGYGNVLILENALTGAKSSIQTTPVDKGVEGKVLKFSRIKQEVSGNKKIVHKESPEFVLYGNIFKGYDIFIVEKYENGKLISKDVVKYKVIGQKISGESKVK